MVNSQHLCVLLWLMSMHLITYLISAGNISDSYKSTYRALVLHCETPTTAIKYSVSSLMTLYEIYCFSQGALNMSFTVLSDAIWVFLHPANLVTVTDVFYKIALQRLSLFKEQTLLLLMRKICVYMISVLLLKTSRVLDITVIIGQYSCAFKGCSVYGPD